MIRGKINKITCWYNRKDTVNQMLVLGIFCVAFVLLGWISIRFITFDTRSFQPNVPVNIGCPSGLIPADPVKLNKQ